MKKLFLMTILVMAVLAVNAQRTSLKVTDLPKAVTDYVTKDYAGFTISEASKLTVNNVVSYEVMVMKGTTHDVLSFDSNGKFLKKLASQGGAAEKKNANPPAQSKPPIKK